MKWTIIIYGRENFDRDRKVTDGHITVQFTEKIRDIHTFYFCYISNNISFVFIVPIEILSFRTRSIVMNYASMF